MKIYYYYYHYYYCCNFACWRYQNFSHCTFATDCTLPHPDLDSIRGWSPANSTLTKLKSSSLQGKLIQLILLTNCVITHTDAIKNLGVLFGTFFFHSLKMMELVHTYGSRTRLIVYNSWRNEQMRNAHLVSLNLPLLFPTFWTRFEFSSSVSRWRKKWE